MSNKAISRDKMDKIVKWAKSKLREYDKHVSNCFIEEKKLLKEFINKINKAKESRTMSNETESKFLVGEVVYHKASNEKLVIVSSKGLTHKVTAGIFKGALIVPGDSRIAEAYEAELKPGKVVEPSTA